MLTIKLRGFDTLTSLALHKWLALTMLRATELWLPSESIIYRKISYFGFPRQNCQFKNEDSSNPLLLTIYHRGNKP